MNKDRFIIFGCGGVGQDARKKIERKGGTVIAYSDNNKTRWGTEIDGVTVVNPNQIPDMEFEYIAIGVFKAALVIKEQLCNMGIPPEKVFIPIEADRIFYCPISSDQNELTELPEEEFFSNNTRKYDELNIVLKDDVFLEKLERLKEVLLKNNIPRKKVCVVSGAILQVFGLRESKDFDDIDIIMTDDLRKVYGEGLVIVSDSAEVHKKDLYSIKDNEIIMNMEHHFVFNKMKFMHPKILIDYGKKNAFHEYSMLEKIEF